MELRGKLDSGIFTTSKYHTSIGIIGKYHYFILEPEKYWGVFWGGGLYTTNFLAFRILVPNLAVLSSEINRKQAGC